MIGDPGDTAGSAGSGGGGGVGGFFGGFAGGFLGARTALGSGGTGVRSALGQQILNQVRAMRQQQQLANLQNAMIFSHTQPGTPTATVQTNPNPTVVKLAQLAGQIASQIVTDNRNKRAAKKQKHELGVLQKKIAHAQAVGAVPQYQTIALTGLNMGPPLPGRTYY